MSTVIKVENLSKQYRLGTIGTGTLSHDINRWWHRVRGKEDPYLKIGHVNDRTQKDGTEDYVWALRDINFEVKAGEVLGVIGRNGAGKSTLLKILSRTTLPTTGNVKVKGRIASLLEVGTGFHPELTGRENIFLNGAILGMRKAEIKSKFDEIVDFAGVGKYVDTPVKRYSSGMYVRLAFAVAAHLDPEILIVDEVLAVGDAEFQKKCLGKMKDVSVNEGRTVLFVSHNIGAISELCQTGLLLRNGVTEYFGDVNDTIDRYVSNKNLHQTIYNKTQNVGTHVKGAKLLGARSNHTFMIEDRVTLFVSFVVAEKVNSINIGIALLDRVGTKIFSDFIEIAPAIGETSYEIKLPIEMLLPGSYSFDIAIFKSPSLIDDYVNDVCPFLIEDTGYNMSAYSSQSNVGVIRAKCEWIRYENN